MILPFWSTVATFSFEDVHFGVAVEPFIVAVTFSELPTSPLTLVLSSVMVTEEAAPPPPPPLVV